MHDVDVANLDLLQGFDDIKGQGGGAGNTARHGPAHKVGAHVVRAQAAPQPLKQRPVQRGEGDVAEQGGRVAAPQPPDTEREQKFNLGLLPGPVTIIFVHNNRSPDASTFHKIHKTGSNLKKKIKLIQ